MADEAGDGANNGMAGPPANDMAGPPARRHPPIIAHPRAIPPDDPLYVFGAGQGGAALVDWLQRRHPGRIVAVVDNVKTGAVLGAPIISPARLIADRPPDALILIASQHVKEIHAQLTAAGVTEGVRDAHPCAMRLIDYGVVRRGWTAIGAAVGTAAGAAVLTFMLAAG